METLSRRLAKLCACCDPYGAFIASGMTRRRFLATGAAAGFAATRPRVISPAAAQPARPAGIIDIHHHFTPPTRLAEMRARGIGERPTLEWTLAKSLDMMDRDGVARAVISVPNIWMGDRGVVRKVARDCNEYIARVMADHPGRFGLFACLPLPDVEGSLREIDYAFDQLHADGVGVMTSFEDKWLGDPVFAPVLDELNRRKAVVFVHPSIAACCSGILPAVIDATIEFGTDTTRAIASLIFGGTTKRCPDIRFIFSHAGGTVTSLVERFVQLPKMKRDAADNVPNGVVAELKKFYYDIAQTSHPVPLGAILSLVSASQILFGTDFPWRTAAEHSKSLRDFGMPRADIRAIERDNAVKLIPRLAA
jgi:predicted TIM-barrel fold metal-dependent hydrolase